MIELWHCADARSFRALWALEELALDYKLHLLPFPPRLREPEYLKINPLGTIPAMRDGETFMTESAGIVQYLVTRYGPSDLALTPEDPGYGAWINWLHHGEATLTFPQTLVLRYRQLEPGRAEHVADDYAKWFLSRLRFASRTLETSDYLVNGRFTAADISVGYALLLAHQLKLNDRFSPAINAYWERLKSRPAFLAAKAAQKGDLAQAFPA